MKYIILVILLLLAILLTTPTTVSYSAPEPIPEAPLTIKEYAEKRVLETFGSGWAEFDAIIKRESRWISTAQNPHSTAFGYGQFLNSTWKIVGCKKTSDPHIQIDCAIKYIKKIYGTPQKAWAFWQKNHWY